MVSIIITAYNVEAWIERAVASACNQTYGNTEVIVVEDCSTDGTRDILSAIAGNGVRVLYNPRNIGAGASRRRGIEAARGEYILLLDGDDWLEEDFVEALRVKAEESGADIVSGGITVVNEDGSWNASSYGECIIEGREKIEKFWGEKIVFMNNKLIHRSLHEKVPYSTRRFIEDTPVIIPMLHFANRVAYVDNAGYNYRMNGKSLTHSSTPFKYALFRALCADDLVSFFEEHDKGYLEQIPLAAAYAACVKKLKECRPTAEMIEPYKDEWIEFTTRLIDRLCE